MSHFEINKFPEIQEPDFQRVDKLSGLVGDIIKNGQSRDPVEAGLLKALLPELDTDGRVRPHMAYAFAVRRLRGSYFPIGYALRTLEFSLDKQLRQEQVIANNHYPSHTHTEAAFHYYDVLLSQLADILPGGKADIFTFSATIFEMPPDKLRKFFSNFLPYCNPGAIFIVNDFARVVPEAPGGFRLTRGAWWNRLGQFASFVIDPFQPEQPPVEIARFLTRRCEDLWFSKAGLELIAKAALNS
jgi:hypothetical protein